ncbi:hypothetical protein N0V94_005493 [Neodidymelliopsis sp. IMI 364377]|nr:hypothetical protein N0V94_005493 [Neodidymelliopsis sp. IMI 364377]
MSSTRANQHPWVTAYEAAPPAACATLRNLANTVEWGVTKQAAGLSKDFTDGHETKRSYEAVAQSPYNDSKSVSHASPVAAATAPTASIAAAAAHGQHETPEWNAELDATEAERRRYMAVQGSLFPGAMSGNDSAASPGGASEASELGGMMRMNRKPVAPVELDSKPLVTEMDGRDGGGR